MQYFKLPMEIQHFKDLASFAADTGVSGKDLILTSRGIYRREIESMKLDCNFIFHDDFGSGEPTDIKIDGIMNQARQYDFQRLIAIGGGTVLDISKLLVLRPADRVLNIFERKIDIVKEKELVCIPTTCGTGSEVTNITVMGITSKATKMGLADDGLYADKAVLIPSLLEKLPFEHYTCSAIDALIHAIEAYVSPKANAMTKALSKSAIETIMDVFMDLNRHGHESRLKRLEDILVASNMAGIAFGNAGVGAVHAMSYPLGGKYHVPHGEANYQFLTEVLRTYLSKKPEGAVMDIVEIIENLSSEKNEDPFQTLEDILGQLIEKKPLRSYGMAEEEVDGFARSVYETQTRLLNNNFVPFTLDDLKAIYARLH